MRVSNLASLSTSRRICIPLVLLIVLVIWKPTVSNISQEIPPDFEVVDFYIKDYRAHDAGYRDKTQHVETISPTAVTSVNGASASSLSYEQLRIELRGFVNWDRPNTDHWPSWHDYDDKEYDPNRWESFERRTELFVNHTVVELEGNRVFAEPFLPYPEYNSEHWMKQWVGEYVPCSGPAGETYFGSDIDDYVVQDYRVLHANQPRETVGSAKILELDQSVCFDRISRLSAYEISRTGSKSVSARATSSRDFSWASVRWGELQNECINRNQDRYASPARLNSSLTPNMTMPDRGDAMQDVDQRMRSSTGEQWYKPRTAILIRSWEGYQYRDNDIQSIRSLITETALISGGEYQVFLLVNIKQKDADIYDNETTYHTLLEETVPMELRDIAILWTEKVLEDWYPKVGDWQVYWMQFMPLQWFSKHHPEFEYIWNWETDARYIGNHYHFLERVTSFARDQPRKHLWERNSRFYFPDVWNDDYEAFRRDTDAQILEAESPPVWGPQPYAPFQIPLGPTPPHPDHEDNFGWGVGEEADLITLQPIWDPSRTGWSYRNHIWNFIPQTRPHFTADKPTHDGFDHAGFEKIPRRTFINTLSRLSRRLLHVMHEENLEGRCMQAEMWPATVALHHGLKAVYAPHPIWTDRKWPA